MPHPRPHPGRALAIAALLPIALLSGCAPVPPGGALHDLEGWLASRPEVEAVDVSTVPAAAADQPDVRVFAVDLDDDVTAAQTTNLLEALNDRMDGHPGAFEGGQVRLAPTPGRNELSLDTHAETTEGAFADAVAIWFALADRFDDYSVEVPYVDRGGWATERVVVVNLPGEEWSPAADALRALDEIGAFAPDGESSSAWVRTGTASPWWGDRPAQIGFEVGQAPGEALLGAVEALDALQSEGVARFDFTLGPSSPDGATLGVLAVVEGDTAAFEASEFDAFSGSPAWTAATRIVDELAGHGIPFSLSMQTQADSAVPFANLDTVTCELTISPFSPQLTEYWRGVGGAC